MADVGSFDRARKEAEVFSRLTFLVVDDNRAVRMHIRGVLNSFKIQNILEAGDAGTALMTLKSHEVHVVLLDKEMPLMDGIEMTKLVRRGGEGITNTEVPIIMVTGHSDQATVVAALKAGIHDFLAKPFSPDQLMTRIRAAVFNPPPFLRTANYIGPDRRPKPTAAP